MKTYIEALCDLIEVSVRLCINRPSGIHVDTNTFDYILYEYYLLCSEPCGRVSIDGFDKITEFNLLGIRFIREHTHKYKCSCGDEK